MVSLSKATIRNLSYIKRDSISNEKKRPSNERER